MSKKVSPPAKLKAKAKAAKKSRSSVKPKVKAKESPVASSAAKVLLGTQVPHLTLPATGGTSVSLAELSGQIVVLYFYPRDATPGCTVEGHEFSQLRSRFERAGTVVYGVSRDTLASHEKFKVKEKYAIELLSDVDESACQSFGVMKLKNMYGKQVRGIERSTFVIGRDGSVLKEWRGVKVPGHAAEVLEFVQSLK